MTLTIQKSRMTRLQIILLLTKKIEEMKTMFHIESLFKFP